jgi:hypothetical protein
MSLSFRAFANARGFKPPDFPTISPRTVYAFVFPTAPSNPISLRTLLQSSGPVHVIGYLDLSVSPSVLTVGENLLLVVTATDPQTGTKINGLPVTLAYAFFTGPGGLSVGPDGPSTSGVTGSPFAYTPQSTPTPGTLVAVYGAPSYLTTTIQVNFTLPQPPPPPPPQISTANGPDGDIIVKGKYFPSPLCSISPGSGWGFVTGGPWNGNILNGILMTTTPCDNPLGGQYYTINITSAGNTYTFTINC